MFSEKYITYMNDPYSQNLPINCSNSDLWLINNNVKF